MREDIEWTRSWCTDCNDSTKPRILLIGDSICDGYYDTVFERLNSMYAVDKLVSSRSVESEVYKKQLELFLNDFKYDLISFNNGLHGFHLSKDEYSRAYEKILHMFGNAKVILTLSTPIMQADNLKCYNEKDNRIVIERNESVRSIGVKYGLPVCDLYSAVNKISEIRAADGVHYMEEGYKILGNTLAEFIENM